MFHTAASVSYCVSVPSAVVIPWRGFRCFTQIAWDVVVADRVITLVVIPWRGFRCFTPDTVNASGLARIARGCNPLAGI